MNTADDTLMWMRATRRAIDNLIEHESRLRMARVLRNETALRKAQALFLEIDDLLSVLHRLEDADGPHVNP